MPAEFFVDSADAPLPNQPRRIGVAVALVRGSTVLMEHHLRGGWVHAFHGATSSVTSGDGYVIEAPQPALPTA